MRPRLRSCAALGACAVVVALSLGMVGCDSADRADPADPGAPVPSASAGAPTGEAPPEERPSPASATVRPRPAPMPDVALRQMYLHGADAELVSSAGVSPLGPGVTAYVPTRSGVVFARGPAVYAMAESGAAEAIGPATTGWVTFAVDPTLRYVMWALPTVDSRRWRTLVYDVVARRTVFDLPLPWSERLGAAPWVRGFGGSRTLIVHLDRGGSWAFATRSGDHAVVAGGPVYDLRRGPEPLRTDDGGVWSPGLRYRVAAAHGGRPWRVTDEVTGRDVTPRGLSGSRHGSARLWGWLGNRAFGVLVSSGTWRHTLVTAYQCHVGGRCEVAFRYRLGVADSGLGSTTEGD